MTGAPMIFNGGKRLDGRGPRELRPIRIEAGIIEKARGSAYVEWGDNKVMASVFVRNMPPNRRGMEDVQGVLNCQYNLSPFSVDNRKRPGFDRRSTEISIKMKEALEYVVRLDEVPRTIIDVYTEVLEAAAGTRCASLTAASVALADAQLPLRDLLPACAVGKVDEELVLDLLKSEDNFGQSDVPLAWVPSTEEFVLLQMDGRLTREQFESALDLGREGCRSVYDKQLASLKREFAPAGKGPELDVMNRQGNNFWQQEIAGVLSGIKKDARVDGRAFDQRREVEVATGLIGTADGSARVKLGRTEVIAGVKFEPGAPYPDHPEEGTLSTNVNLSPLSLSSFGQTNTRPQETETARVIDRGIRSSGCLDLGSLCITPGAEVMTTYIDLVSVNYDGNLQDAGTLAALSALGSSIIPLSRFGHGEDRPLRLLHTPLTSTFAKVQGRLLTDPTFPEEMAAQAVLTVSTDETGDVCAVQKGAWGGFSREEILACLERAAGSGDLRERFFGN